MPIFEGVHISFGAQDNSEAGTAPGPVTRFSSPPILPGPPLLLLCGLSVGLVSLGNVNNREKAANYVQGVSAWVKNCYQ
jgi:hypothetical protein